jgi:predicted nucleotidyltransferase component of viral defense system
MSRRLLEVSVSNVERDYLFGWVLAGIFASELGQRIALKGGNALRKGYLPTSRFSDDLDFSTSSTLDPTVLIDQLNEVCRWVEQQAGVRFDYERNAVADEQQLDRERLVYKVRCTSPTSLVRVRSRSRFGSTLRPSIGSTCQPKTVN